MVANRGPVTSGVTLAMIVVATVFVLARFYTRIVLVRSVKQDDWWILAAWLCAVGFSAAVCVGVADGLGEHWSDVAYQERDNFRRAQFAYSILYNPCLMLTKNSIIVFYLSVMSKDADPVFRWCNWITLAVVNIAGFALTCLNIFQCRPISAGYTYPTPDGAKCADIVTLYLSSAPVNIITDLALLLLPMPILTGLRLPKKQKIILVCTFSAGIFVAVVDVVRIAYLQNAALESLSDTGSGNGSQRVVDNSDFSWDASLSFLWSAIEVNVGIICACVPSLKPLFLKFAPNFIKDEGDISPISSMDMAEKQEPLSTFDTNMNVLTHPAAFRKPAIAEYEGDDDGDYMGFLNMLANDPPGSSRKGDSSITTTKTLTRTTSTVTQASEFGFVKMDKNKNMLKLNNRQSFWPVAVVTFVFFLWGFAYGLLDVLNSRFQQVLGLSYNKSLGLRGAYYGGYFVGPFTLGRFMLHRYGFKSTMIAGLCVYGCGTLVFWPSAVLLSYPAFCISNFIVGFGLSCLEVASNPYIALCGPLEYAEVRLNFSQAFQAVGSVCSPILAQRVLFKNVVAATSLVSTQWAYLGISLFDFALAIAFYYIPLPEATEEQLEIQADKRSSVYRTRVGPFRVIWVTLGLGAFCQWCYVGAQEANATQAGGLLDLLRRPGMPSAQSLETINRTSFALGRFVGCFMNYMIKPRWLLMICFVGSIVLSGAQMGTAGGGGIAVNNLIYFFEGSIFPIVYAISMRGMGDQTFNAAAIMTAAISSGAVVPVISWAVTNLRDARYAFSVVLAIFAFGALFPLYLNLMPAARRQVDPLHDDGTRRKRTKRPAVNRTNSAGSEQSSMISIDQKFGLMGIVARRKKQHEAHKSGPSFMPSSQHIETTQQQKAMDPVTPISPRTTNPWDDLNFGQISKPEPTSNSSSQSNIPSFSSRNRDDAIMEEDENDDYEEQIEPKNSARRGSSWSERRPSFWGRGVGGGGNRRKSQWEKEKERERDDAELDARRASQWAATGTGRRQSKVSFVDTPSEESSIGDKRRSRSISPCQEEETFDATMSGGSGEELTPFPTQEKRPWTEEDDVRDDYHKILRGL